MKPKSKKICSAITRDIRTGTRTELGLFFRVGLRMREVKKSEGYRWKKSAGMAVAQEIESQCARVWSYHKFYDALSSVHLTPAQKRVLKEKAVPLTTVRKLLHQQPKIRAGLIKDIRTGRVKPPYKVYPPVEDRDVEHTPRSTDLRSLHPGDFEPATDAVVLWKDGNYDLEQFTIGVSNIITRLKRKGYNQKTFVAGINGGIARANKTLLVRERWPEIHTNGTGVKKGKVRAG